LPPRLQAMASVAATVQQVGAEDAFGSWSPENTELRTPPPLLRQGFPTPAYGWESSGCMQVTKGGVKEEDEVPHSIFTHATDSDSVSMADCAADLLDHGRSIAPSEAMSFSMGSSQATDADHWARLHEQLSSLRENVRDLADRTISPRLHEQLRSCQPPSEPVSLAGTSAAASSGSGPGAASGDTAKAAQPAPEVCLPDLESSGRRRCAAVEGSLAEQAFGFLSPVSALSSGAPGDASGGAVTPVGWGVPLPVEVGGLTQAEKLQHLRDTAKEHKERIRGLMNRYQQRQPIGALQGHGGCSTTTAATAPGPAAQGLAGAQKVPLPARKRASSSATCRRSADARSASSASAGPLPPASIGQGAGCSSASSFAPTMRGQRSSAAFSVEAPSLGVVAVSAGAARAAAATGAARREPLRTPGRASSGGPEAKPNMQSSRVSLTMQSSRPSLRPQPPRRPLSAGPTARPPSTALPLGLHPATAEEALARSPCGPYAPLSQRRAAQEQWAPTARQFVPQACSSVAIPAAGEVVGPMAVLHLSGPPMIARPGSPVLCHPAVSPPGAVRQRSPVRADLQHCILAQPSTPRMQTSPLRPVTPLRSMSPTRPGSPVHVVLRY